MIWASEWIATRGRHLNAYLQRYRKYNSVQRCINSASMAVMTHAMLDGWLGSLHMPWIITSQETAVGRLLCIDLANLMAWLETKYVGLLCLQVSVLLHERHRLSTEPYKHLCIIILISADSIRLPCLSVPSMIWRWGDGALVVFLRANK